MARRSRIYFGDGGGFGFQAHYSVEDSPLGRGGAIRQGFSQVPAETESVMVLNGDIITSENPENLLAAFQQRQAADSTHLASIMVVPMVSPLRIGGP